MLNDTMLVCDMDGTLLDSNKRISDENYNSILDFVKNGGKFTIATGRMKNAVLQYLERLPINIPAILFNGAQIYDFNSDKVLWEHLLPLNTIEFVKEILDNFSEIAVEIYFNNELYFIRNNEETKDHQKRENFKPIFCDIDKIPKPWTKVIIAGHPDTLKKVEILLKSKPLPFRYTYSEPQFLELLNFEASKGHALEELSKITGISINKIIAVGDNLNDVEMITNAGTGIAVDNAHPELKKIADECCLHHDEHAISQIVSWIKTNMQTNLNEC